MRSAGVVIDDQPSLLLAEGTRLVHIGPHKTGTTSLQGAFHAARREVARQGVHYASPNRQAKQAARAVAGRSSPYADGRVPAQKHWTNLLRDVEGSAADRVLLSAEGFADAAPAAIRRLIGDLDPARVHVVATLRPLARILPSQWQQYVQNGLALSFDDWLRAIFNESARVTPTFWHRHRHDRLLARWMEVVGRDRLTAVVVDDRDHEAVLRTFERLLGLRDGTLRPTEGIYNRSLTRAEVDLVRAMHAATAELGMTKGLRLNVVLHGAAANMKLREPAPDEPRIELPGWLGERLEAVTREIVDGVAASGVRVIGDLERLVAGGTARKARRRAPSSTTPWPAVESRALMGVLVQTGLTRGASRRLPDLGSWSTPRLASLVVARTRSALGPDSVVLRAARSLVRRGRWSGRRRGARSKAATPS